MRSKLRYSLLPIVLLAMALAQPGKALADQDQIGQRRLGESFGSKDGDHGAKNSEPGGQDNSSGGGNGLANSTPNHESNSGSKGDLDGSDGPDNKVGLGLGIGLGDDATGPAVGGAHNAKVSSLYLRAPVLDQEQSKMVIGAGRAATMPLLIAYLNQHYPGEVLDVKLHTASDGFIYEVRYLSNVVFLNTVFLDAQTLQQR